MTMKEIATLLQNNNHYMILTHRRPDGDTIGSAAALCLGLRKLEKDAWIYNNPQFTARFTGMLQGLSCKDFSADSTILSVDIASDGLLCFGAEECSDKIILALDHHASNTLTTKNRLILPDRAACGEIIYELLRMMDITIDKAMADALYIAISTDTGCFKYSNTTSRTLRIAADLLECGADTSHINKVFFDTKSFSRLQLEARLTASVALYANGLVGLCTMPKCWMDELSISEDDIDSISGFARAIEGVEIGIMIREVENGDGKISLRTGPDYDACKLCAKLGGGGHAAAAGCTVEGGIEKAKQAILQVLRDAGIAL